MEPLLNWGHETIDLRELAYVGPAGCPHEGTVAVAVTLKSGVERTLYADLPAETAPVKPKPEHFPASMFADRESMLRAIGKAKTLYAEEVAALARIERAKIIAAWEDAIS